MTPEQFKRVEGLFHEVKELPDDQRRSFLASACDDQIVHDEVLKLLEHARTPMKVRKVQSDAARVLDGLTVPTPDIAIGTCIGPYRIVQLLGEGGMGLVYLAEQQAPIHRRVALKLIKLGMDTKQTLARFETEREALALMNHPNVARVFDAAATEQGRPYFVMEYVDGVPITEYCDKHRLSTEERLRLFMDVCNAIQHAHQKGIIHRDIKPSNVLVSVDIASPPLSPLGKGGGSAAPPLDKGGLGGVAVKVIDFGVAKATQHRLTERTLFTEQGQLIGTPGYMSPEQAEMTALDIDTRTDIYSLGVLLYELLVGERPFDDRMLREAGLAEIQRMIREVDPPKPSTRLSNLRSEPGAPATDKPPPLPRGDSGGSPVQSEPRPLGSGPETPADQSVERKRHDSIDDIAHRRHTEPKTLIRQIRGDLDWIVMRAMEKDRTRRYDTANALAMEIQRYLNNEPVLAGPPSAAYRMKKLVRRNKGKVIAASVILLSLTAGIIGTTTMWLRATWERDRAEKAASRATAVTDFLTGMFKSVDPGENGRTVTVASVLDAATSNLEHATVSDDTRTSLYLALATSYRDLGLLENAEAVARRALSCGYAQYGENHLETARIYAFLGALLCDRGKFEESDRVLKQCLRIREASPNTSPLDLADTLTVIAQLCLEFKEAGDPREFLAKTSGVLNDIPETDAFRQIAELNHTWGKFHYMRGEYELAKPFFQKAVAVLEKHSPGDPYITLAQANVAGVLNDPEAELGMYFAYLRDAETRFGDEHYQTAGVVHAISTTYMLRGRYEEARPYAERAVAIRRKTLGNGHRDTLDSINNLARCYLNLKRFAEAEDLFTEVVPQNPRIYGETHPYYRAAMWALATAQKEQGKYAAAADVLTDLLKVCDRTIGRNDEVFTYLADLVRVKMSLDRVVEATDLARDLVDGRRTEVPRREREFVEALGMYADALERTGQWQAAVESRREACQVVSMSHSDGSAEAIGTKIALANALANTGQFNETERLLISAWNIMNDGADAHKMDRQDCLSAFAVLYDNWDAAEPGKGYAEKAAEWRARLTKADTPDTPDASGSSGQANP